MRAADYEQTNIYDWPYIPCLAELSPVIVMFHSFERQGQSLSMEKVLSLFCYTEVSFNVLVPMNI